MGIISQFFTSIDGWIYIGVFFTALWIFFHSKRVRKRINFPSIPALTKKRKIKGGKYETRCREILEGKFKTAFPKIRPKFLTNPKTGRRLELDGYSPHIRTKIGKGLAFEYDGKQHAEHVKRFHKTKQDFVYQVQKDFFKDRVCKSKGIYLLRIPHFIKYDDLQNFINQKLRTVIVLS